MAVSTAKRGTRSPIGKTAPQIVKKTLPRAKLTQIKDAFLENARLRTLIENAQRALIENDERMLQLTSASTPDGEQSARADGSKRAARKQSAAKKVGTRRKTGTAVQALARGAHRDDRAVYCSFQKQTS